MSDVEFAYALGPSLYSSASMLAPMLLHLYSEEVRSKFCCLIPQLIANRLSVTLRHTASHGRPERKLNATTPKRKKKKSAERND